ncbi:MAG: carboxypeptidase-like regulatory domain-containing protein [Candidatus Thermoplasmatota archaeon]|nr:carboxypeptidase-like regulatory domain-containing protein [Candidatus Thermoplasmatota archaeon]
MPTISGAVMDAAGGAVAGALVSIGSFWTNTGSDGSFALEIPPGSYMLKVVKKGYKTGQTRITVTGDASYDLKIHD